MEPLVAEEDEAIVIVWRLQEVVSLDPAQYCFHKTESCVDLQVHSWNLEDPKTTQRGCEE